MEVVSRSHRKNYMKIGRVPLYHCDSNDDAKDAKKFQKMLLQKNFTTLSMNLKTNILNSEMERPKMKSAPMYKIKDLREYQSLFKPRAMTAFTLGVKSKTNLPKEELNLRSPSFYKVTISEEDGQIEHISPHVTMTHLCDMLKEKGLGDPRENTPIRENVNPMPLLIKRKRQEKKYNFYLEKLKGKAVMDMDNVNIRATAFIEQQKESKIRTASANWRERYQRLQLADASEDSFQSDGDNENGFAAWDEDSKAKALDDEGVARINAWMIGVRRALRDHGDEEESLRKNDKHS